MSMYAADDIRSQLNIGAATRTVDAATPTRPSQWIEFLSLPPTEQTPAGSRSWIARAANLVLVYTAAKAGDVFRRSGQPDEYTVLTLPHGAALTVTAGGSTESVDEDALIIVPPGDSTVRADSDGAIIRLFSVFTADLRDRALNAYAYLTPDPRATPLVPWPEPHGGCALRVHRLAETPIVPDRFGRIFRTTNMMVNVLGEETAPRDPHHLSPHHHDDFEQISLALEGRFVHHIRYPWGPDSAQWRDDEHREIGSPSICIIPPPAVHTTQGVGERQQLIDIFSPPRLDFSESGWVLNADTYPQP